MIGNIRRKAFIIVLTVCLALILLITGCKTTSSPSSREEIVVQIDSMDAFTKFGNIALNIRTRDFFANTDFEYGDAVRVRFLDHDMVLPLVSAFSLLDIGETGIDAEDPDPAGPSEQLMLFTNLADFATKYGVAHQNVDSDGNWYWTLADGVELPIDVTLTLEEKGAYPEFAGDPMVISTSRSDYLHLTDTEYANIRMVTTSGFGNCFYRGSSPIDSKFKRDILADATIAEIGIDISINLSDSKTKAENIKGFSDTYYSKTSILFNEMGVDYRQESFRDGLRRGFQYIADNEGVYYVHCSLGKDRTGLFCAILEALMGASAEEVIEDYMNTFVYFYGLQKGPMYDKIADTNICSAMEELLELDCSFRDVPTYQLSQATYRFLLSIGLSDSDIASLKTNLARVRTV
jgi:hypothetical protein